MICFNNHRSAEWKLFVANINIAISIFGQLYKTFSCVHWPCLFANHICRLNSSCMSHTCRWIWVFHISHWMKLLAVLTLLQCNLDPLLPLGPFYPPLPTSLRDNTAALYHFSWLTPFGILHCSVLHSLLYRKHPLKWIHGSVEHSCVWSLLTSIDT